MNGNFQISYLWRGQVWRTVVEAPDSAEASRRFRATNPHVEFVGCYDSSPADPDAPPAGCGHGPDSCPKMSARGYCMAHRCPYGLKVGATVGSAQGLRSCP